MELFRSFRTDQSPLEAPWHSWGDQNIEYVKDKFLRLWCRGGIGCGIMYEGPASEGFWQIKMRTSGPLDRITTKVCVLLWPDGGKPWPPEIDFNESGDRLRSHQSVHYGTRDQNYMHHTNYLVDQTQWHVYGCELRDGVIKYTLDGLLMAYVDQDVPLAQPFNLHIRAEPHNDPTTDTMMDVKWVRIQP